MSNATQALIAPQTFTREQADVLHHLYALCMESPDRTFSWEHACKRYADKYNRLMYAVADRIKDHWQPPLIVFTEADLRNGQFQTDTMTLALACFEHADELYRRISRAYMESGEVPPERPRPVHSNRPGAAGRNHPADVNQTEAPVRTIQVGDIIPTANGPCELYQDADGRRYLRPIPVDGVVPTRPNPHLTPTHETRPAASTPEPEPRPQVKSPPPKPATKARPAPASTARKSRR